VKSEIKSEKSEKSEISEKSEFVEALIMVHLSFLKRKKIYIWRQLVYSHKDEFERYYEKK
jgi:hypothetical protein